MSTTSSSNTTYLTQIYDQILDSTTSNSFELYVPERSDITISFNHFFHYKKANVIMGLLDDQNYKKYQECHSYYLDIFKQCFEMLLDQDYSIAVNTGYLKIEDLENYSYAGLLNIETEALLRSAKVFSNNINYNTLIDYQLTQDLIDKIYRKVLFISFLLSQPK